MPATGMAIDKNPPTPSAPAWRLRPLADADRAALLRLNAGNYPSVYPLDESTLAQLLGFGGHHLVAVDPAGGVIGYLLSFPSTSAYDDTEINGLRRHVAEPFLYICQVVIASEHRGCSIGRALYAAAEALARRDGAAFLGCDVNLDPPNPESLAFHRRLGFVQVGTGTASNGFAIAYLARRL